MIKVWRHDMKKIDPIYLDADQTYMLTSATKLSTITREHRLLNAFTPVQTRRDESLFVSHLSDAFGFDKHCDIT